MMKRHAQTAPYQNSLFRRMVVYYLTISFVTILLFCFVWYQNTSEWIINQNLSYNRQQLEALYKRMESQHLSLKQTQYRMYTYQLDDRNPIYNLLADYIGAIPWLSSEEMMDIQGEKQTLYSYVTSIERPREKEMRLFMFTGFEYNYQDIYFAQTNGRIEPEPFAEMISNRVFDAHVSPSRRSVYTIPSFLAQGNNGLMYVYVLYDYIRNAEKPSETIGYVINAYNPDTFDTVLRDFINPLVGRAYILDSYGNVLYDSVGVAYGETYADFHQILENRNKAYDNGDLRTTVLYHNQYDFYVVGELGADSAFSLNTHSYVQIFKVATVACIFAALFSILVVRTIAKRVIVLLGTLYDARTDISTRAPLTGANDELDAISVALNSMLEQIEDHIYESYKQEIRQQNALLHQREAELYALQSQVNPHFLYNTLEIIRMKALANNDKDTAMMIKSLANLFRERTKGSGVILLKQELLFCRQIMEIYSIRHDSTIELVESIDPALLSCAVLRDILTPLLENVMVHGLRSNTDPEELVVAVRGWREGNDIVLRLIDNGKGMDEETLQLIKVALRRPVFQSNYHVGLMNIHSRTRMVYGEGYGLNISSALGQGASIEIRMRICTLEELTELATKKL